MPRPPEPAKRRALARRAARVLQREGLEISAARLAAALGIKRPTLLYHFATYGELIEVALADLLTEQAAFVLARVAAHAHPIDRLYAQLRAVHEFHRGHEARVVFLTQAIAASAGPRMERVIAVGNQVFDAHRRAAADAIRDGIARGTVMPCDAAALVSLVRAVTDGLMVQRVMTGAALEPVHALLWERLLRPLKREPRAASVAPARRAPAVKEARR
jgi:TetR/AcrR family transcriptional regulator